MTDDWTTGHGSIAGRLVGLVRPSLRPSALTTCSGTRRLVAPEGVFGRFMSRSWRSLLASALSLGLVLALAGAPEAAAVDERLRLLGEYSFPSGLDFQGTT